MNPGIVALLLLFAATLEVAGDAIVRVGLRASSVPERLLLFAIGGGVLFAYGIFVNTAPADFGRLLGIYVVLFFIVAQVVNRMAFGITPSLSIIVGGVFILLGGTVMTVWKT